MKREKELIKEWLEREENGRKARKTSYLFLHLCAFSRSFRKVYLFKSTPSYGAGSPFFIQWVLTCGSFISTLLQLVIMDNTANIISSLFVILFLNYFKKFLAGHFVSRLLIELDSKLNNMKNL
jgi:hypothetical protein